MQRDPPANERARIVVVDDDEAVRVIVTAALARAGYDVVAVASGDAALTLFRADGGIRLLVSDIVMPEMTGPELAEHVAQIRPGLPVLFISGYEDDALRGRDLLPDRAWFLRKPFTIDALLAAVRGALEPAG